MSSTNNRTDLNEIPDGEIGTIRPTDAAATTTTTPPTPPPPSPPPIDSNNQHERATLLFEFEREVNPGVALADAEGVRFIWNERDPTATTGFEITVNQPNDESIAHAEEQIALSLANILSSVTGTPINYGPPEVTFFRNGRPFHRVRAEFTARWNRPITITHIDLARLASLLHTHSKLYLQFAHAHNGQKAFFRRDYPQAIREYFLIFENSDRQEETRYRNLRNAVSHVRLDSKPARDDLRNNFGIDLQIGQELDVDNPQIREILLNHTRRFRDDVGDYLQEQLREELARN
jgi:hypothetical protein